MHQEDGEEEGEEGEEGGEEEGERGTGSRQPRVCIRHGGRGLDRQHNAISRYQYILLM